MNKWAKVVIIIINLMWAAPITGGIALLIGAFLIIGVLSE